MATAQPRQMGRDEEMALFSLINKVRALQGWGHESAAELEKISAVWWREFSRYKIPVAQYQRLLDRAHSVKVRTLRETGKAIPIDATLIIAQWTGEHGLAAELRQRDIDARRYLPDTAASDCERCFGSGIETVPGKGARPCDHGQQD